MLRGHCGHDISTLKWILYENLLLESNTRAEGCVSEIQVVLGWDINMHTLMIFLPEKKLISWLQDY